MALIIPYHLKVHKISIPKKKPVILESDVMITDSEMYRTNSVTFAVNFSIKDQTL